MSYKRIFGAILCREFRFSGDLTTLIDHLSSCIHWEGWPVLLGFQTKNTKIALSTVRQREFA